MSEPITPKALQDAATAAGFGTATLGSGNIPGVITITLEKYAGKPDILGAAQELGAALGVTAGCALINTQTGPAVVLFFADPDAKPQDPAADVPANPDGGKPRAKKG